jgi:ubiquinone/menaquinone biosynthesis C-methylase UbiE
VKEASDESEAFRTADLYTPSSRVWATYDPALIPSSTYIPTGVLRPLIQGNDLLDLGCGVGSNLQELLGCQPSSLVGIDVNWEVTRRANILSKGDPVAHFVTGDAGGLPFKTSSFDVVTAQALLTVIPTAKERESILAEASRVLRPGGHMHVGDFLVAEDLPFYRRRYERGEKLTGEFGSFLVEEPDGHVLYVAHHFNMVELTQLLESHHLTIVREHREPTLTRSGKKLTGISILARRI